MNREELERQLDEWLDRASAEYAAAEARPGFEARIAATVNSRLARRRQYFRWLSRATAAAAVLVFSCYVILTRFEDHPATESVMQVEQKRGLPPVAKQERPSSVVQVESSVGGHALKRVPIAVGKIPKDPFLSARLSDQERYFLSFVKTVSAQASTGEPEAGSGPLKMPGIEIPTIQIPKAQISSIKIDMVPLPTTHQSEDQL